MLTQAIMRRNTLLVCASLNEAAVRGVHALFVVVLGHFLSSPSLQLPSIVGLPVAWLDSFSRLLLASS